MVDAKSPIGDIDSGVGGLTTVAQLSRLLPGENIHHGSHDTLGTLAINTSGPRSVYETVFSELGISRDYTLTQVQFSSGNAPVTV